MRIASIAKDSELALCSFASDLGIITCAASDGALCALWMSRQRFFGLPFGISEAEASAHVPLSTRDALRAWTPDGSTLNDQDTAVLEQAYQWTQDFLAGMNPDHFAIPLAQPMERTSNCVCGMHFWISPTESASPTRISRERSAHRARSKQLGALWGATRSP